jgi:hypothetical protein
MWLVAMEVLLSFNNVDLSGKQQKFSRHVSPIIEMGMLPCLSPLESHNFEEM